MKIDFAEAFMNLQVNCIHFHNGFNKNTSYQYRLMVKLVKTTTLARPRQLYRVPIVTSWVRTIVVKMLKKDNNIIMEL